RSEVLDVKVARLGALDVDPVGDLADGELVAADVARRWGGDGRRDAGQADGGPGQSHEPNRVLRPDVHGATLPCGAGGPRPGESAAPRRCRPEPTSGAAAFRTPAGRPPRLLPFRAWRWPGD